MVKKTEYESNNFGPINAHAEVAEDNEKQLLRLRRFKADRYGIRNLGLLLLSIGLLAIMLAIAYAIYKKYYGATPIIETRTIEVIKEVPGPERIKVVTKEVSVPGPERIVRIPGESKIITVPGPERIVIKKIPIQADEKNLDNFTLFSRKPVDEWVIVTGKNFKDLNSNYPDSQYCYARKQNDLNEIYHILRKEGKLTVEEVIDQRLSDAFKEVLRSYKKHCLISLKEKPHNKNITPYPKSKTPSEGATASGSGFFVNNEGYIITNDHVVNNCKSVWVQNVENTIPASIIHKHPANDLAIIKIEQSTPNYAKFTNSTNPVEDVMALGFPRGDILGSEIKRTKGSISSLSGIKGDTFSLQHTALIQKGNSGGPLINKKGAVVGVNYAKFVEEDLQGIGLAIKAVNTVELLGSKSIDFSLDENDKELEWSVVFENAKQYTTRVICSR